MKTITIAGNIGKDAALRRTQDGTAVLSFSVAVSDRRNDETTWFDCTIWGNRATDKVAGMITKGSKITVNGDFSTREHEGKTYLQVRVNDFTMQGGKPGGDAGNDRSGDYAMASGARAVPSAIDDEIPF
jgi:single-strand DNA-binding protein